jgi:hypothetical protein
MPIWRWLAVDALVPVRFLANNVSSHAVRRHGAIARGNFPGMVRTNLGLFDKAKMRYSRCRLKLAKGGPVLSAAKVAFRRTGFCNGN